MLFKLTFKKWAAQFSSHISNAQWLYVTSDIYNVDTV